MIPVERQIQLLFAARDRTQPLRFQSANEWPIGNCEGHATDAATLVRRALSIGNLPRLARTLRKYATAPYGYTERGRASCAILALAIEAIIARRPKPKPRNPRSGSKSTLAASAQIDRKPARKARIAVDNRVDGELIVCGNCGKEFPAKGRNRNVRIYCSPKCTNQAWTKAHPRRAIDAALAELPASRAALLRGHGRAAATREERVAMKLGADGPSA